MYENICDLPAGVVKQPAGINEFSINDSWLQLQNSHFIIVQTKVCEGIVTVEL